MTSVPPSSNYYSWLADAFLHGQTSLLIKPDPGLLSLPDPYDPGANGEYRLRGYHDALLYQGKFYLSWGPVPALLLAPLKWITQDDTINDAYLVFAFAVGLSIFSALLILALWRRLFFDLPWWAITPGILVAGLSTPIPFLLGRPAIYEAAIASGQCFLIGGIYWAFTAFESERLSVWKLLLAGICWTFAVGSRVSLVFAVVMLSAMVVWRIWRKEATGSASRMSVRAFASFGAPLVFGAISLALYNYVRFGSWSEIGIQYQLAGHNIRAMYSHVTSTAYILPNLFSYLLRPVSFDSVFPFVYARAGNDPYSFPRFISKPQYYYDGEPVAGILLILPFVWFALVPLVLLLLRFWKVRFRRDSTQGSSADVISASWIILCLFGAVILGFAPVTMMYGSTMRYLADVTPSLVILSMIGVWQGFRLLRAKALARRTWISVVSAFAFLSITFGILLGVTSYFNDFKHHNRVLFDYLRSLTDSSRIQPIYQGALDVASCDVIAGWAWDKNNPDTEVNIELFDGDALIASVPARLIRPDVGQHAFHYVVPPTLKDGRGHPINVRIAGTNISLTESPNVLTCTSK
jgi:hypothetical protein